MQFENSKSLNKCKKCGMYMNDLGYSKDSRGTFNAFECPWCFHKIETQMELYRRKY